MLKFYEIDPDYVDYIGTFEPHLYHNSKAGQAHSRKFLGIVFQVNGLDFFAPLSSFKPKFARMKQNPGLVKVGRFAVISLINMFPVPKECCLPVVFARIPDEKYRNLLKQEYRIIAAKESLIRKSAAELYKQKVLLQLDTPLTQRCVDFSLLEQACLKYACR